MATHDIRLGSADSVFSVNRENTVHFELEQTTNKLPLTDLVSVVDQYEVYRKEVAECTNYRLTLTVKPYCTNVLFNTCTEIVANDGAFENQNPKISVATDSVSVRLPESVMASDICGKYSGLSRAYMVENTEYSSESIGFKYYPGYDIFGNHILRNLTFRPIIPVIPGQSNAIYNTIEDYMREMDGTSVKMSPRLSATDTVFRNKHVYEVSNILSMQNGDSVEANLTTQNGWYGFVNNSSIVPKRISGQQVIERDSNHAVNDKGNCEFVDMYPDRTLFSFTPKLNPFKRRMEKNWDVFLTYPYENFYHHNLVANVYSYDVEDNHLSFNNVDGDGETNALMVMQATNLIGRNGMNGLEVRSYCKHNLSQNDSVAIYKSFDGGVHFTQCENLFRVSYVGDMDSQNDDYYFTLTDASVLDEIFEGMVADVFYTEVQIPPDNFQTISGDITEIPQERYTDDDSYASNICQYYYALSSIVPSVQWTSSNTKDEIPKDVIYGPDAIRLRKRDAYTYFRYNDGSYELLGSDFNHNAHTFGNGNTFDDIPIGYVTEYIRVHTYDYYEKAYRYYVQRPEPVRDIINDMLVNHAQLRFAKVVNGTNCKYYIRRFKKLPNMNHTLDDLTDSVAFDRNSFEGYVRKNAYLDGKPRGFDCEIYPLSFSNTIYGDGITQYQFLENIGIDKIRDNLGRPLTEIYTTIVKKNVGYKSWYGPSKHYSDYEKDGELHRVEYSHCFGKVTSALEFLTKHDDDNVRVRKTKGFLSDATVITNVYDDGMEGCPLELWGGVNIDGGETEGVLENDDIFFGDIVEYNPYTVTETTLSDVQFRFNTAQRENGDENDYKFTYKELVSDDYYPEGFKTEVHVGERPLICPEGYYYKAHYPVKLRAFGDSVRQASHFTVMLVEAKPIQADGIYIRVETLYRHAFSAGNRVFICDDSKSLWYNSVIAAVDGKTSFTITPIAKDVSADEGKPYIDWIETCTLLNNGSLKLRVENVDIPDYAANVGTNTFLWRDIIPAFESDDEALSSYPFANGALYADSCINFYLKRQDPDMVNGLYHAGKFPDIEGKMMQQSNYEYIPETEVLC